MNNYSYITGAAPKRRETATWQATGALNETVFWCMCTSGTDLYLGGRDTSSDSIVYQYDGIVSNTWTSEGNIRTDQASVRAMADRSGTPFCGLGDANGWIYKRDGASSWSSTDVTGTGVRGLINHDSELWKSTLGTDWNVYKYNGSTWDSKGQPGSLQGVGLISYDGDIYAFDSNEIYVYDTGTTWNAAGTVTLNNGGDLYTGAVHNGVLYLASRPTTATDPAEVFYFTAPSTWTSAGTVSQGGATTYYGMASHDGNLYLSTEGAKVVRYDGGTSWSLSHDFTTENHAATFGLHSFGGYLFAACGYGAGGGEVYRYGA